MKNEVINEVLSKMMPYLNNEQLSLLKIALDGVLSRYSIKKEGIVVSDNKTDNELISIFIDAKHIEGCSDKSLKYYKAVITNMLNAIKKPIKQITTDDLRKYLTTYQDNNKISKVSIDNMRRILSSFYGWLEDEDYILKSPVRRIHKVKTDICIKETYTDETLEVMRDNCKCIRDLAIIDMLSSTGMRIGEMVLLNKSDVNFNEI